MLREDHHGSWWGHPPLPTGCHAEIEQLHTKSDAARWNVRSCDDPLERSPVARIPVVAAKRVAADYGQQQVVLVTWDGSQTHVVTYGRTVEACRQAAQGGNKVKKALGWPEHLCNAAPARGGRAGQGGAS